MLKVNLELHLGIKTSMWLNNIFEILTDFINLSPGNSTPSLVSPHSAWPGVGVGG